MMHSRLDWIRHWPVLAQAAGYCVVALAAQCCVSTRQLQRFIRERMASSPHHWLRRMRMEQAVSLLRQQTPRKQIAVALGYRSAAHFARDFKSFHGLTTGQFLSQTAPDPPADVAFRQ